VISDKTKAHCDSMPRDKNGIIDCRTCAWSIKRLCHKPVNWSRESHIDHADGINKAV